MDSDSVSIAVDLFPAKVVLPSGGVIDKTRVTVANGEVIVWTNDNGTPREYFRAGFDGGSGTRLQGYVLTTPDGDMSVSKSVGCGCGSPLKNMNPWPGKRKIQTPL